MSLCYFLLSFSKGLWIVVFPFIFIVAVRFDNIVVSHRVSSHSFVKNGRFIIVVSKCSCLFFFPPLYCHIIFHTIFKTMRHVVPCCCFFDVISIRNMYVVFFMFSSFKGVIYSDSSCNLARI